MKDRQGSAGQSACLSGTKENVLPSAANRDVDGTSFAYDRDWISALQEAADAVIWYDRSLGVRAPALDDSAERFENIENDWLNPLVIGTAPYADRVSWATVACLAARVAVPSMLRAGIVPDLADHSTIVHLPEPGRAPEGRQQIRKAATPRSLDVVTILTIRWDQVQTLARALLEHRRLSASEVWEVLDPGISQRLKHVAWRFAGRAVAAQHYGCPPANASIYHDWHTGPQQRGLTPANDPFDFKRIVIQIAGEIAERDGVEAEEIIDFDASDLECGEGTEVISRKTLGALDMSPWEFMMRAQTRAEAIVMDAWPTVTAVAEAYLARYRLSGADMGIILRERLTARHTSATEVMHPPNGGGCITSLDAPFTTDY